MIEANEIISIIEWAKAEVAKADTKGFSEGKYNRHLSKAFVAGVGHWLRRTFPGPEYETMFQDYKAGRGVSGEWLFDASVVQQTSIKKENVSYLHVNSLKVAVESEMSSGFKDFLRDFSKLQVVNAEFKIYFNGVNAEKKKDRYVSERIRDIVNLIDKRSDNGFYIICFLDAPALWKKKSHYASVISI